MPSADISALATCTTCSFAEDTSNYWTANMYFKARNGSYKRVPQIPNRQNTGEVGGVTVYYTSPGAGKTTAFKPVSQVLPSPLRWIVDSMRYWWWFRDLECWSATPREEQQASIPPWKCKVASAATPALTSKATIFLPAQIHQSIVKVSPTRCAVGSEPIYISLREYFSHSLFEMGKLIGIRCWDGKNLDSPDHKTHVAYPTNGPASFDTDGGACPSSHPVKIPQLMLEVCQ